MKSTWKVVVIVGILIGLVAIFLHNNIKKNNPRDCKSLPAIQKNRCYEEKLRVRLSQKGVASAFDLLSQMYEQDKEFVVVCHALTHEIGKQAFYEYDAKGSVEISGKVSYCGYGFYHGYMEALLSKSDDIKKAQKFCDYVNSALGNRTKGPLGACFHGIGHGFVEDIPKKENYGDSQKIIAYALGLCDEVGRSTDEKYRCDSGVYNGLAILYAGKKYDLLPNQSNPYADCEMNKTSYGKRACYEEMNTIVPSVLGFEKGLHTANLVEAPYQRNALYGLATYYGDLHFKDDNKQLIAYCRQLPKENQEICINGIIGGILINKSPEAEIKRALEFCKSNLLTGREKNICYGFTYTRMLSAYDHGKIEQICASFEERYRNVCKK